MLSMRISLFTALATTLCCTVTPSQAAAPAAVPALVYPDSGQPLHILPLAERTLPTITAQRWATVSTKGLQLEGPAFDREGNLLLVEVLSGKIFKLGPDGSSNVLVEQNMRGSAGIAIHKDGRLFVAGLGNYRDTGNLTTYHPDGRPDRQIIPPERGMLPDDIVFDSHGGLYFTDFRGGSTNPEGGVYYIAPESDKIIPVLSKMALPNGIALSPDGKVLWVTEFATGLLHRVDLEGPGRVAPFGALVAYHFSGPSPDSMRADQDGNLYVAQYGQGRVLVFNPNGIPIGQILIPGREDGHFLRSTSMALKPGTREIYLVANDGEQGRGAAVFRAVGFTSALPLFSHQAP